MAQSRVEVRYTGRVQGVGFRYTTSEVAEQFTVTGYVRNLPDGSVRMVAEGEAGELKRLIEAIQARMGGFIDAAHVERSEPNGEFPDFSVRY